MDESLRWRYEKVAFLALSTLKGVGFRSLLKIAQEGRSYYNVIRSPGEYGLDKYFPVINTAAQIQLWHAGVELARKLAAQKTQLIFRPEPAFPANLRAIPDAPEWLFVQGQMDNLHKQSVTVVGTRKPSEDGIFLTRFLLAALAIRSCPTVSGLAAGIDQVVHTESIRYGIPTIAVLGTGILQNYPKGSEKLREEIVNSGGTIVTEYLPTQSYSAENFVRRNRLQAGLGEILFPTEWSIKSGTAHTVKFAHRYNKKIVNLHLPLMSERRPEIRFATQNYGALAMEVPTELDTLQLFLTLFTESFDIDISNPPPNSGIDDSDLDAFYETETKNQESDPQIPLL